MDAESDLPSRPSTQRVRLDLAYDGTDFAGWAVQPGRRTVAGALGEALTTLFRGPVPMVVAGRTDAGVHAAGQVAHIDVDAAALAGLAPRDRRVLRDPRDPRDLQDPRDRRVGKGSAAPGILTGAESAASRLDAAALPALDGGGFLGLRRRLAGLLPADLRVRRVTVAPAGFDARFSALRRHYAYRISTADWGCEPLRRFDTLRWGRPLEVDAMARAAARMLGLHDFAAYCRPREGATTVRDLQRLEVRAGGDLVCIEVTADAFCHSMVRSLVGVLLAVGSGRFDDDRPAALLGAARRTAQIAVAPAHGLTLTGVDYPPDAELAARAERTRAVRETPAS